MSDTDDKTATPADDIRDAVDVFATVQEIDETVAALKRAIAGHEKAAAAARRLSDQLEPDEKPAGMPVFHFPATFTGSDRLDVYIDTGRIHPQLALPLVKTVCDIQVTEVYDLVQLLASRTAELAAYILRRPADDK